MRVLSRGGPGSDLSHRRITPAPVLRADCGGPRVEAGQPSGELSQPSKQAAMVAWTRGAAGEVVRSGWILIIF